MDPQFINQLFEVAPIVAILVLQSVMIWRRLTDVTDRYVKALEEQNGWLQDIFLGDRPVVVASSVQEKRSDGASEMVVFGREHSERLGRRME